MRFSESKQVVVGRLDGLQTPIPNEKTPRIKRRRRHYTPIAQLQEELERVNILNDIDRARIN